MITNQLNTNSRRFIDIVFVVVQVHVAVFVVVVVIVVVASVEFW